MCHAAVQEHAVAAPGSWGKPGMWVVTLMQRCERSQSTARHEILVRGIKKVDVMSIGALQKQTGFRNQMAAEINEDLTVAVMPENPPWVFGSDEMIMMTEVGCTGLVATVLSLRHLCLLQSLSLGHLLALVEYVSHFESRWAEGLRCNVR